MLKVSVIVVVYNAIDNIKECLSSLLNQDVPVESYEILCVDNNSTDGTQEVISNYCEQWENVRLIVNPIRGIAGSRNIGIKNASYDLVAFTDSDCVAPNNWLNKLIDGFETYYAKDRSVAAVGSSNIPPDDQGTLYETLTVFLNTFLGSHGSVQGKRFAEDCYVPHIPTVNVLYDRQKITKVNGFDVTLGNIGEDQDLSYRLEENGFKLVYLRDCAVVHKLRPTIKSWLKNMFTYGKGRTWLMRKHPDKIQLILLAPALLVTFLPLAVLSMFSPLFLLPLMYFLFIFLISIYECQKVNKLKLVFNLFILYCGTHLAYGSGQWYGLFKNREFYRQKYSETLIN